VHGKPFLALPLSKLNSAESSKCIAEIHGFNLRNPLCDKKTCLTKSIQLLVVPFLLKQKLERQEDIPVSHVSLYQGIRPLGQPDNREHRSLHSHMSASYVECGPDLESEENLAIGRMASLNKKIRSPILMIPMDINGTQVSAMINFRGQGNFVSKEVANKLRNATFDPESAVGIPSDTSHIFNASSPCKMLY